MLKDALKIGSRLLLGLLFTVAGGELETQRAEEIYLPGCGIIMEHAVECWIQYVAILSEFWLDSHTREALSQVEIS